MVHAPIPRLFALLGDPVAGNPTEVIVEDAFRRAGLDWRYLSIRVESAGVPNAVAGLRALGFAGFHVTVPHKVAVAPLVDRRTPAAEAIGAVNCVKAIDKAFVGDNTDGRGLVRAMSDVASIEGARVLLFGAGGAARAAAVELAMSGAASVRVVNRDPGRRDAVVAAVRGVGVEADGTAWPAQPIRLDGVSLVVQATTAGMPDVGADVAVPVDWSSAAPGTVAADVVIAADTPFVRAARGTGLTVLDGLTMLVEQAALSVEWWTGSPTERAAMRRRLRSELGLAEEAGGAVR